MSNDILLDLAEQNKGRADDCGTLSRLVIADREKRAQAAQPVVHQHGFAEPNRMLRVINESLDKQLEEAMAERDSAEDFADTILDLVLGKDRAEWSSAYGRADALIEVEEHMAALPTSEAEPEPQVVQDNNLLLVEVAGLQSSVGHLSALVDEQRRLLVEVEQVCGRDAYGAEFEDGDSELIDKVRSHLAATEASKPVQAEPCCVNWAAGTSCFADPKQDCPRLPPMGTAPALMEGPLPMDTAPKDGTMLRLLVQFENCSFDDSNLPCWVCGFNLADNTGEDKWQFPGWSWVHDYILDASDDGKPIGWLPMLATKQAEAPTASNERAAYVDWLSGTYPDIWSRSAAEHNWEHKHVSVLAWQARAALATQQEAQPQAEQSARAWIDAAPTIIELRRQVERKDAEIAAIKAAQAEPAGGDKEDAERYRLVRRGQHWSVLNGIGDILRGEDLDAAVDAIRAARAAQQATGERT